MQLGYHRSSHWESKSSKAGMSFLSYSQVNTVLYAVNIYIFLNSKMVKKKKGTALLSELYKIKNKQTFSYILDKTITLVISI